ncbi:4'-phosphopantetheinyl transferase superfamily protein [Microbispora sp. RL4-1S]|uniref:4'-phosphopantetheinyl transferase superfamily protein n=1 Tax=Microbispora oryzae TaxID=2806554 RepID=A0A940WM05_9ACTN|nr:4'-phosphopantetheinyl transferase superfamily protein [Microbispora oryzae]MBP2703935.1 4'-phosphopantetheinyl transferase superfamily protein [Microbispora oryzae]
MIERILPDGVAAAEVFDDPPGVVLFPEEEAHVARAVAKRRAEFTAGRHCARTALAALGFPPVAIPPGEAGSPTWPAGVVGSITHCAGYRAAAVSTDVLSVGIDAEPDLPLPAGVLGTISLAEERETLAGLGEPAGGPHWDRLLFSAKESVYKAWFPLARRWLDFTEALIRIDRDGSFSATLLVPGPRIGGRPLTGFRGRWLADGGLLTTSVTVHR